MEYYNNEELISSLIVAGYNKVDKLLLKLVKEKIAQDETINKFLSFDNKKASSSTFSWYIRLEDLTYELNGKKLTDSISCEKENIDILVGDVLPLNKLLVRYLINVDLTQEILTKAKMIGIDKLSTHADSFSNREINILKQYFGNDIFGELYSYSDNLHYDDYRNLTDEGVRYLMNNYLYKNFIYEYCLNDHQKKIALEVLQINNRLYQEIEEDYDDILTQYAKKADDYSVLVSVCDAYSRVKR